MNRHQLSQLMVFACVARHGSFRAAADELGIAASAVSHAVSVLEKALGVRLLARTTRSTRLTKEGEQLLQRVGQPLTEIESGLAELAEGSGKASGSLRLTMPLLAVQEVIMPRLAMFTERYPSIELDIRVADGFEDIVEKGFDAGIRLGERLHGDMIALPVGPPRRGHIVGSPAYFARYPAPAHPRDLAGHNCIRRRFDGGRIYRWELERHGQALSVEVQGNVILPQQALMRQAALGGIGLAYLFELAVIEDIRCERLIPVLQDWCPAFAGFYVYYPSRQQMRPALRAFLDFYRCHDTPAEAFG